MNKRALWILAAVAALGMALVLGACSSSGGKACTIATEDQDCGQNQYCGTDGKCHDNATVDGGEDGSTVDGDGDGGLPVDQGPPPCTTDQMCPPDKVCDLATHTCVAGSACTQDFNCPYAAYCEPAGNKCYCDPTGQVCKKRVELCKPCTADYECPDPALGDKCITYPDGKFCGQRCGTMACPMGYDCDQNAGTGQPPNGGQCRCNTNQCGGCFVCHKDSDCASNEICSAQTGACAPKCYTDTNCASGMKCHFTGHCAAPCAGDGDCDSGLICCTAAGVPVSYCDAASVGKCRPAGCVLHSECLVSSGNSLGYCDKRTHECKAGCRMADPPTIYDCRSGMKCDCVNGTVGCDAMDCCPDPGENGECACDPTQQSCASVTACDDGACIKIPCNERGDVSIACARSNVCCGWPVADGYPCPTGVPTGDCYLADKANWCAPCSEEGKECAQPAGYGFGEKGVCLTDAKDNNKYCHIGCRTAQDCPSTWACSYSYLQGCDPAQGANCEDRPTATCEWIDRSKDDQGQVQESLGCLCVTDDDCPADINGFRAVCQDFSRCDHTVVPTECHQVKVCKFAKACQCMTCCSELSSGG